MGHTGIKRGQAHRRKGFRGHRLISQKLMQQSNYVCGTRDDAGLTEGLPVNAVFGPKSTQERMGICQHFAAWA
ncbi:MAG: hypothetical protein AUG83_04245 [Acidobacteria bacterium 13_1_20CM_4_57_11]|nr:MAG: hypothetical protein AUG83_04245 [Acidobacteria bacterium 13_1_20CM_4_57_11]